jgi:hypothetical protein
MNVKRVFSLFLTTTAILLLACNKGPTELKWDDGQQNGMTSIAEGGHAVEFTRGNRQSHLTQVKIYSMRYGRPNDQKNYTMYVLDKNFSPLYEHKGSYQDFAYGSEGWIIIDLNPPAYVPREFWVCFEFNPWSTYGVYCYYDTNSSGHSRQGTPKGGFNQDPGYDWMIRAVVE